MTVNNSSAVRTKVTLMQVIDQLSTERVTEVLDFALFVRAQQAQGTDHKGCENWKICGGISGLKTNPWMTSFIQYSVGDAKT